MAWTESNEALSGQSMDDNAREVHAFFTAENWTLNAICGMLGNMWRESTINPGVWQNFKVNYQLGYGLVQWTPATKIIDWCLQRGFRQDSGEAQCKRILWELEQGIQYYKTSAYPLTFKEYSVSTESVEYLTRAFFANYERGNPDKADMPGRIKWANYYFQLLEGNEPQVPEPTPDVPKPPDPAEKVDRMLGRREKYIIFKRREKKEWQL